jgi:hypothetical protein
LFYEFAIWAGNFWHPFWVLSFFRIFRGYRFAQPPGYFLAALLAARMADLRMGVLSLPNFFGGGCAVVLSHL